MLLLALAGVGFNSTPKESNERRFLSQWPSHQFHSTYSKQRIGFVLK